MNNTVLIATAVIGAVFIVILAAIAVRNLITEKEAEEGDIDLIASEKEYARRDFINNVAVSLFFEYRKATNSQEEDIDLMHSCVKRATVLYDECSDLEDNSPMF